jgi:hypothetical protein
MLAAPLMIAGGIALATAPAQAATTSPANASTAIAATAVNSASVKPAENWIWVEEGIYDDEEECEQIGLDEFEDGYARDYECEPAEVTGACSDAFILWLEIPENLDATTVAKSEAIRPSSSC